MRVLMLLLVATLAGCAVSWPQNPQEFRERAKNGPHQDLVDNIEVSRPLAEVSAALRRQSAACLNQKVTLKVAVGGRDANGISHGGPVRKAGTATYKSTFSGRGRGAEVAVQRKVESTNQFEVGDVPEDGAYRVVADATAVSANRTRLDVYRMFYNDHTDEAIRDALVHWAKGDSQGCPVLER